MQVTLLPAIAAPLLAQEAQPQTGIGGFLLVFLPIMAIFYFLLIRPAQQQRKRHQQMVAALKNGDKVITNGGIYGTIVGLRDEVVQLRIADQVRIEVARSAIAGPQRQPEEQPKS
ncbi:MAG: preprotein translocase subunit YajC [Terriglobia bacterium]